MPIEIGSNRNLNQYSASQNSQNAGVTSGSAWVNPYAPEKVHNKVKLGVLSTTFLGVASALAILAKNKGASLNPAKIFKGPLTKETMKTWKIFSMEYKCKEILTIGAGSILGGLTGGFIFDKKENRIAKLREAVIQYAGNICTPLACIGTGLWAYKKKKEPILRHMFSVEDIQKLKITKKYAEELNKLLKTGPKFAITTIGLIIGIFLGNKIGNLLNEEIFNIKDNRKLKAADMSPHIDDVCYAISLADEHNPISHGIARVVPAALMISGYQTGVMQEKPQIIEHERLCQNCKNA